MPVKAIRSASIAIFVIALVVGLVGWRSYWFRARSVTEWVDSIALFDEERNRDLTGQSSFQYNLLPVVVTNDPALCALIALGPTGVPILEKLLSEPPQAPPASSIITLLNGSSGPPGYSSFQEARKSSAALALLALGTNANGGVPSVLQACSASGRRYPAPFSAFIVAKSGLPHRRAEIIAGIGAGLAYTNVVSRRMAAMLTRIFPDQFSLWKNDLMRLIEDPDEEVQEEALRALRTSASKDSDVVQLFHETLQNRGKSTRLRATAAVGLGMAGAKATNSLPLLHEALNEPDKHLQSTSRRAIRSIEEAMTNDKALPSQ